MKIVCLNGSPRKKGSTAKMLDIFCDAARDAGAETSIIPLNTLSYKGCQGCMICKGKLDYCVLKDDLTHVLKAVADADVLVLGTPVYFGEVTGQMKSFIDRTFSFLAPGFTQAEKPSRLKPGKKLVMILPQGAPDKEVFKDIFPRYSGFYRWFGYNDAYELRGLGIGEPDMIDKNPELIQSIKDCAKTVTGNSD